MTPTYPSLPSRPALIPAVLILSLTFVATAALAQTTSPSTTVSPYIESALPGVTIESILTVDDGTVPKTGGGSTRLVGIPDGIGVIDGSELPVPDPGVFWLLVHHELNSTQGIVRDHGNAGAFISRWVVDKTTHEVLEGDDLIKQAFDWDEGTNSFVPASIVFDRLCSADRPAPSALYNPGSGLGSQEILFFGGEESFSTGRAWGHVVTGADAGKAFHLEHLGFAAHENVVLSPFEQDTTVAVLLDDAENGEVYVYVGAKQATGTEVEKAGLVGGNLYAVAVVGKPYELDLDLATAIGPSEPFTLKLIGTSGDRPIDGSDTTARGLDTVTPVDPAQTFESLKFGGPEDGVWDTRPGFENVFYFATKGTASNGINAPTRLWKLEFASMANPALGGTLTLLLDGPELRLGSLDNMGFATLGGAPKLLIQEDLGGDPRLSKIWEYDIATGALEEIAQHTDRFFDGAPDFLTTNEESSGIVSLENVLGEGWFAASIQVHTSTGLSNSAELVEQGQLVLLDIGNRGSDLSRDKLVASGDLWDYRVDGVDPGAAWNDVGFVPGAGWNQTTDGTPTGPVPTMLGYGEAPGQLDTDVVLPAAPRAAAYYFRREFDLPDPSAVILFDLYAKVDDGAVVYINDVEVARYNLGLDLAVDNDTFASVNAAGEGDWQSIPLTGASIPLQATGNVIAVSVHQESANSSDMRFDLELVAWTDSPDSGAAPAAPANVATSNPTEVSLDLTWDAQADARFFRIERRVAGDVAWAVAEPEYPGTFTGYTDTDVLSGTTYEYRMWAVNLHGRSALSAVASGTTAVSLVPVIFEEDFEVPASFGKFSVVDVAEPGRGFSWVLWDFGSTGAVQGNNFGSGFGPTEDWLITTDPINFQFFRDETLTYDAQISFGGPAPEVLYSTDYDPIANADPNTATWTVINVETSSESVLTPQGPFDISSIPDTARIAFKYTGLGGSGGQSVRATFDDVLIKGNCGFDFEGAEDSDLEADPGLTWEVVNRSSGFGWRYDSRAGQQGAVNNNFGSPAGGITGGTAAEDWLISPPIFVGDPNTGIDFDYYENFGDTLAQPLSVLVTNSYTGDPETTTWVDITPAGLDGSTSNAWIAVQSAIIGLTGDDIRVAFLYESAGASGGTTKRIGVDNVCVAGRGGPLEADFAFTRAGGIVTFIPTVMGGTPPYQLAWDFGDGNGSQLEGPTHEYVAAGLYTVTLTVTDDDGTQVVVEQLDTVEVTEFVVPAPLGDVRIATFNASMNRPSSGDLAVALASGTDTQIQQVAEVIQRADPDVLVVNEFDQLYDANGNFDLAATEAMIADFKANYLEVAQAPDTTPVFYDFHFVSASNTGVPSGFDLDNDGSSTGPGDAYGFGSHPGQFAMILLSKYEIVEERVRTFQLFRWKDMPGALLPPDPNDSDGDGDLTSFYTADELEVFRLSSKTHVDVPVYLPEKGLVHVLASHPTPPVFDDGTATVYPDPLVADWNGLRNHDEIRFWADYVDPSASAYIYDDREWARKGRPPQPHKRRGGLMPGARFVIMGDQNADPDDGDATFDPISLVLGSPAVDTTITPASAGALEQVAVGTNRETKTASFDLRVDYVVPSVIGWTQAQGFVFWPLTTDLNAELLAASDHRMVVMDLQADGFIVCGLGAELVLVIPAVIAVRRRMRRR